jgi:hypothetical protein
MLRIIEDMGMLQNRAGLYLNVVFMDSRFRGDNAKDQGFL